MIKLGTTIILLTLVTLSVRAQTVISGGDVTGNWDSNGSPYLIEGDLVVGADERLTIEPGVTIVFNGPYTLEVSGRIDAVGTQTDSIYFSCNDTTGFSTGSYNGWFGISFNGYDVTQTENSFLKYCNVSFSQGPGITCLGYGNLVIENSAIVNNKGCGLMLIDHSDITAENIKIADNGLGGIYNYFSSPQITEFKVVGNQGTGIYLNGCSAWNLPVSLNSGIILNNISQVNGGGILASENAHILLQEIEIGSNSAQRGGGISCFSAAIEATDLAIHENQADFGGGFYAEAGSELTIDHVLVYGNLATQKGGGLYNSESSLFIDKTTIVDNIAIGEGGAAYYELFNPIDNSIKNSILWMNYPDQVSSLFNGPEITYSDIQGGFGGEGNIDQDPLFTDAQNNDYHLTWVDFPYESELTSPCIDRGDPASEFDPDETIADMGAFYFEQVYSTMTQVNEPEQEQALALYPNPATSVFNLTGMRAYTKVVVADLNGRIIREYKKTSVNGSYRIDDLVKGVYLVEIFAPNGKVDIQKLIKN